MRFDPMREVNDSHVMNQSFTSMLNDAYPNYDVARRQNHYDVAKHNAAQYDVNSRQHQYDATNGQQHRQHYDVTRQVIPHGNSNLHGSNQMSVAGSNQNFGAPSN